MEGGAVVSALDEALWPRASLPRRPMLGAVLAHLTGTSPALWAEFAVLGDVSADECGASMAGGRRGGSRSIVVPWTTTDPAEAWELLQARDLIPLDYRGRFVCGVCGGSGLVSVGSVRAMQCPDCDVGHGHGHRPHPPTVAALASWASLGFAASDDGVPGILGAEELARTLSPDAPVWWRVAPQSADAVPAYTRDGPAWRLLGAGLGWWRRPTHTALIVPPL